MEEGSQGSTKTIFLAVKVHVLKKKQKDSFTLLNLKEFF